ncbi:MAG: patatin-like phospholipase family protein [Acholeplasma sp.]|nr:patatin-like phospholipase family protein [Acholeplasma sp.]
MIKIGIVLSGALAKGAYQVGFLDALLEKIDRKQIVAVSGASVGACNAYGLSTNKMASIRKVWQSFNYKSLFHIWRGVVFNNHIDKTFNLFFDDNDFLDIPLFVSNASVFPRIKFHYVRTEGPYHRDMRRMMKGAIGFPFLMGGPKFFRKRIHTDGGIIDNIPIYPLTTLDIDLIIVLHFDPKFELEKRLQLSNKTILEIDLSVCNDYIKQSFDFRQQTLETMYQSAYVYGKHISDRLFNHSDMASIHKEANLIMAEESVKRAKYKALDTWPSRLNRFFRKKRYHPNVITSLEDQYRTLRDLDACYCINCKRKIKPDKHFSFWFFFFTWWIGFGILHFIHYKFISKPVCPYCKKRKFSKLEFKQLK